MTKSSLQSNTRFIWGICTFVVCIWVGALGYAQTDTATDAADVPQNPVVEASPDDAQTAVLPDPQSLIEFGDLLGVDYSAWESVAERTEGLLMRGTASAFVLGRLRTELRTWNDTFTSEMEQNAERLVTVKAQIAALGPVPEEGVTEDASITDRRDVLIGQHDELAAPGLLAAEAHARADGMMSEIEIQLRARQAQALKERGISPLNPVYWPGALAHLYAGTSATAQETTSSLIATRWTSEDFGRLATAAFALLVAICLFLQSHVLSQRIVPNFEHRVARVLSDVLKTILQAILPLIGLIALIYGLRKLDIFGVRGEAILAEIPLTGSIIILASWLGKQFFSPDDHYGPLNIRPELRGPLRRYAQLLAWGAALWLPYVAFVTFGDNIAAAIAVLNFPFIVVLSILLFRFSSLLRCAPDPDAGDDISTGRTRSVIGRLTQGIAIAAPLLAAFGFDTAAKAVLFPAILTLGLLGVVVYLQSLGYRVYELLCGTEQTRKALIPLLLGFVLLIVSLPILALIWGAQSADLIAYWSRFTEGFTWGETRISPSDFLTFILIFSIGYVLTGFIKTTLRNSVLPRTSLDLGAQDAIVAGFGYIGIFTATVVAITSAGIDLSNLAIVAGALSVGIGFGLQTIVSNFVSGIILLIERPISQGDWIEVGDRMGYVRNISVRSTRIETFDRTDVIVPNADLISNQVINWTRGNLAGRLILRIGVGYGSDADKVSEILKDIAENHPMVVMTPPPSVLFMNFGADALEFEIRAILRDINFINNVLSEMNFEIARRFKAEGIEIPFAQRDIWLRNPEILSQAKQTETETPTAAKEQHTWTSDDPSSNSAGGDAD